MSQQATMNSTSTISPEEYLEGEKLAYTRHEYIDGKVYAMAGDSRNHNTIAGNVCMALRAALRGSPCRVFMENVKTRIQTTHSSRFYYPDVQVGCNSQQAESHEEREPRLIIEVLSSSTERFDRSDKFFAYRQLGSLEEYLLVAQDTRRVELFRRSTGWEWELYTDEEQPIRLDSVGVELHLKDVYEDVEIIEPRSPLDPQERDP